MKSIKKITLLLLIALPVGLFSSCESLGIDDDEDDEKVETLYVKFMNETVSAYTITTIQILHRGPVTEPYETIDDTKWSSDLLKDGERIAPGAHKFFTLEIPNGHFAIYRLGVDDGNGTEIMLHQQAGADLLSSPTITHWGSDERTVSCTIKYNDDSNRIDIYGWSDWAGLE